MDLIETRRWILSRPASDPLRPLCRGEPTGEPDRSLHVLDEVGKPDLHPRSGQKRARRLHAHSDNERATDEDKVTRGVPIREHALSDALIQITISAGQRDSTPRITRVGWLHTHSPVNSAKLFLPTMSGAFSMEH